ncbi:MAG: cysteine desulfurase family protein [Candidatus Hodarchaeales archaeon]
MKVYLDNNASTRVDDAVLEAMTPFFTEIISPPSSEYGNSFGVEAQEALSNAREIIANKLNVDTSEIIFTSGQAESNNTALKGFALANEKSDSKLILASAVSHSTVMDPLRSLVKHHGFELELIEVNKEGFIKHDHLRQLLKKRPLLVTIPHGNVEIGTIEDINIIANICHENDVKLHVDMTYSFCKIETDASVADMATIASHLIHGPKGVGALYLKKKQRLRPLIDGGFQENRKRAGTENIPGIVGFAEAVKRFTPDVILKITELRDYTQELFNKNLTEFSITGAKDKNKRLPGHFSAVISYVEGESILLYLDMLNFMVATGSACSSKQLKASHVLSAIGLPTEISHGSIRLGLSKYNEKEQLDEFIVQLGQIVERLRAMSPVDQDFMREWKEMKENGEYTEEDHHHHDDDESEE